MSLIGRQTVCDNHYKMFAYDIMFRDESVDLTHSTDISVSASVLDRIMNEIGSENVLGGYTGLLKVDTAFIQSDISFAIPAGSFYLMVLEASLFDPELESFLESKYDQGYRFGINDIELNEVSLRRVEQLLPWIDIIKIDAIRTDPFEFKKWINALLNLGKKVIASKVETLEQFEEYDAYGIDYFQGFFIKRPHIVQGTSFTPSQEETLKVWNLLQNNAELDEIVAAVEKSHALALQMMRFINSSLFAFRNPVTSIRQIVTLIGQKMLSNWLMLMMVAHHDDKKRNHPLLLMVINRTEIMTGLLRLTRPNASQDDFATAYLVGLLSLIHLLLNMEHREFLHKINVSAEIEEAMFEAQGEWGQLLTLTRFIENTDYGSIKPFIEKYKIEPAKMDALIAQAMEKVNAFDAMLRSD